LINCDWRIKLKTNNISIKGSKPKIRNQKIKTELEILTTKRAFFFLGGEREREREREEQRRQTRPSLEICVAPIKKRNDDTS
jgi:hypothetical protein